MDVDPKLQKEMDDYYKLVRRMDDQKEQLSRCKQLLHKYLDVFKRMAKR